MTNVMNTPESVKQYLTNDQYKLYKLIWERFIASLMAVCVQNTVNADRVVEGKFTFNKTDDIDQFFVVENGEVRVFIPEYAWEVVKNDDYRVPPGTYNAVVKISVEADE